MGFSPRPPGCRDYLSRLSATTIPLVLGQLQLGVVELGQLRHRQLFEVGQLAPAQGFGLRQGEGARVLVNAAHHKFIVQVRAGDATGATQGADGLPLFHPLPLVDGALGEVQVLGRIVTGVLDKHIVAVELVVTGGPHAA